jgi:hypothetical protein
MLRSYLGEDIDFSSVSPELAIAIVMELDRPEWFFLRKETLWAFRATVAANAGNVGHVECFVNAPDTDLIVVVDYVRANSPGTGTYTLRFDGAAGGAPVQNDVRDMRIPGLKARSRNAILNTTVAASGIIVDAGTVVGAGTGLTDLIWTPETSGALPFVLTAGHRFQLWNETQNSALNGQMGGYEISVPLSGVQGTGT